MLVVLLLSAFATNQKYRIAIYSHDDALLHDMTQSLTNPPTRVLYFKSILVNFISQLPIRCSFYAKTVNCVGLGAVVKL